MTEQKNNVNIFLKLFIALMFFIGFLIFMYPFIANGVNNYVAQRELTVVNQMNQNNQKASDKRLKTLIEKNQQKTQENQQLGISPVKNLLGETLKNVPKEDKAYYRQHSLGSIFIPKISLSLPIFDTTTDSLLYKGITQLPGSSYPVGGNNTHTVLMGHNGLPNQELFTHLDKLKKGDKFFLKIYGKRLAYQVIRIKVVLPTDLSDVTIQKNQDLATLVTCTPYMVNTHRLLVTGKRVALDKRTFDNQEKKTISHQNQYLLCLTALITFFGAVIFYFVRREVIELLSHKRMYQLDFFVYYNNQPVSGCHFILVDYSGKQIVNQLYEGTSDALGYVSFGKINGGRYRVVSTNPNRSIKAFKISVKHLKNSHFYIKKVVENGYHIQSESNLTNEE
ncbi:class C sortase [Leuconostoc sp. MS02]|uniref:Class C sortase n=1 Tax=Leuconostoc aquikimchii TaxID=3236804 RepID=A0ABV3S3V7_9LACO